MKEQELFAYLKENYWSDLERSKGQFDSFDCESYEYEVYVELKSRKTHYDELLIEYTKYDHLLETAKTKGAVPWYINSTPDGVFGFDLSDVDEPKWFHKWLPNTTEFNDKGHRNKLIGYFHVKYAYNF
jgi:hypothetical protein